MEKNPSIDGQVSIEGQEEWSFREARRDDLDALYRLEARAHDAPWPREAIEEELDRKEGAFWIVDGEEGPAALLIFWRILDEIEILDVAVDPLYQGKGLATFLLATLVNVCRLHKVRRIILEVRVTNQKAIGLYRKLGFHHVGQRPNYYEDNGEDAYIMALKIDGDIHHGEGKEKRY